MSGILELDPPCFLNFKKEKLEYSFFKYLKAFSSKSFHDILLSCHNFKKKQNNDKFILLVLEQEEIMKFSISTILGIILGATIFIFYVSNVRPVGWFDSLVGIILGVIVFVVVKRFKGFK